MVEIRTRVILVNERLDLIVDPLERTVTPRPESPFLPTLKLK